ncbi:hypothetical protein ABTE07_20505, partial [Acinetobacter baumannii]
MGNAARPLNPARGGHAQYQGFPTPADCATRRAEKITGEDGMQRRRLVSILGGSAGNLVEWYDFYAYSALGIYFAGSFFPKSDQTVQLL